MRQAVIMLFAGISMACGRDEPGNASASAYTADADSVAREDGFEGTNSGAELEAPRLIPATQNQLTLMSNGAEPPNPDNLTSYKNMAGDLVNSMIADLYRAGYADSGNFRQLADSVLDDLGGGAGTSTSLDGSRLPQHVDRMQRLIRVYQTTMRQAAERRR
ncbi:MAG TPA: hypothetical protein VHH32_13825 [Gemmatimonadales bacterium]|nr:hypothetical protein [Gemmatimonadales bacterium]